MRQENIPLTKLSVSRLNTRKELSAGQEDSGLGELAESIKKHGLLQPITVRLSENGQYEVIAGQRRFHACKQIGLSPVPCIVRDDLNDNEAESVSLIENVHRADLHPLDKARALKALLDRYDSYDRVSKEVAWSTATIRKYVQLLSLPHALQMKIGTTEGAAGVGALAKLAGTFQGDAAIEVFDKISGFKKSIQEKIIQESKGDLSRIDDLVEEAQEGAFNVRRCGGAFGCEIIRDIIEGEITRSDFEELVNNIADQLGSKITLQRRRTASKDFWKALAKT
jgi:ParB/RepB/Spo0J family partition protein